MAGWVDGAPVRFELLGPLRARRGGVELELGASKQRAVLAVLLLSPGSPVSTERIVDAVWPEEPPENGANTVQKYVAGLRRVLEPERSPRSPARLLVRDDAGYRVSVEPGSLDVEVHADLLQRARAARDCGDLPAAEALLREALELSRGEPLAGLRGPVFEAARRHLVEDVAVTRELLAEVGLAAGRHRELVPELGRLVADFPLREEPRALLMLALYRSGRQAEALDAYRVAHRYFDDELGVEPGERLRDLHRRILANDPGLAAPAPPDAAGVTSPAPAAPWRDLKTSIQPEQIPPPAGADHARTPDPTAAPAWPSAQPAAPAWPDPTAPDGLAAQPPPSPAPVWPGAQPPAPPVPQPPGRPPPAPGLDPARSPRPDPTQAWPTPAQTWPGAPQTWPGSPPPYPAAYGGPAPARPRTWRRWLRALLVALIPAASAGLATFIVVSWFAAWRRSRMLWFAAAGYLGLIVVFFAVFDPDAPDGPEAAVGVISWLIAWFIGTAHTVLLALNFRHREPQPVTHAPIQNSA